MNRFRIILEDVTETLTELGHKVETIDLERPVPLVEWRYFPIDECCGREKDCILTRLHNAAIGYCRKELVETVCDLGLYLFGDGEWEKFETTSSNYKGWIDYRTELPKLYNALKINLNIAMGKIPFNLRIADALACGSFVLTNYYRWFGGIP